MMSAEDNFMNKLAEIRGVARPAPVDGANAYNSEDISKLASMQIEDIMSDESFLHGWQDQLGNRAEELRDAGIAAFVSMVDNAE
jgi:hypothetical protein